MQKRFLQEMTAEELRALPWLFEFWAMDHQLPPSGDWRTWVILGGRGAGKTRAGAEWVRSVAEGSRPTDAGRARRIALIGETLDQTREVMVFGESGLLACSPPDRRPEWQASRKRLLWPNGAEAQLYSAHEPESLRGPQFDAVWADEIAKWPKADAAWDMMQFALRLGDDPRVCATTTPRNTEFLKDLLARESTVATHAPTEANRANLSAHFLREVRARYDGTSLGRQELDGEMLADIDGALWTRDRLDDARIAEPPRQDRIVVAIDPPAGGGARSDECGIIVAGVVMSGPPSDWRVVVLDDASCRAERPRGWVLAALEAARRHGADRIVAEVNQGGRMVEELLRQEGGAIPYRAVHATRGKVARAEPVAALYEQGRVRHVAGLGTLEDQMCRMALDGYAGRGSPDRVDALVWAIHELVIAPSGAWRKPRVRGL